MSRDSRRALVTGATGFVGPRLVRRLLADGWQVTGTRGGSSVSHESTLTPAEHAAVHWVPLDLSDQRSVQAAAAGAWDAVIHLAGISGSSEAEANPGHTWNVNAAGTARLLDALAQSRKAHGGDPAILLVSTSAVYGQGTGRPAEESDPPAPLSHYAASKLGAEDSCRQMVRREGLRACIARPWPHTGPGQADRLFARWLDDLRAGEPVRFGDPEAVRDYLDVRDVVDAYVDLLAKGEPGEAYNVATGQGRSFRELFAGLAAALGVTAELIEDPDRRRGWDERHSVGNPTRLHRATGWRPRIPLDQTFADIVHAQTD